MPTDEQRMRFEEHYKRLYLDAHLGRGASGDYTNGLVLLQWDMWQAAYTARDAEVQALREMLREGTRLLSHMEVSAGYCVCGESPERHPSDHQYVDTAQRVINHWIKDAAALAGGEEMEDK